MYPVCPEEVLMCINFALSLPSLALNTSSNNEISVLALAVPIEPDETLAPPYKVLV